LWLCNEVLGQALYKDGLFDCDCVELKLIPVGALML